MEIRIAIASHGIPVDWPDAVTAEVGHYGETVPEAAKQGRWDLRETPLVTIDGITARDFDDAVLLRAARRELAAVSRYRRRVLVRAAGHGAGSGSAQARQFGVFSRTGPFRCCRKRCPTVCARSIPRWIGCAWSAK
jgi:hypothetical protein